MKKLLVIDDDATFRELVQKEADPKKYTVSTAADGVEGLTSVMKEIPDVILLDINMPRMGGVEFLQKLRASGTGDQALVIVTSNDSSLETISRGTELGIRGYIVKSNESLTTIFQTIEQLSK